MAFNKRPKRRAMLSMMKKEKYAVPYASKGWLARSDAIAFRVKMDAERNEKRRRIRAKDYKPIIAR